MERSGNQEQLSVLPTPMIVDGEELWLHNGKVLINHETQEPSTRQELIEDGILPPENIESVSRNTPRGNVTSLRVSIEVDGDNIDPKAVLREALGVDEKVIAPTPISQIPSIAPENIQTVDFSQSPANQRPYEPSLFEQEQNRIRDEDERRQRAELIEFTRRNAIANGVITNMPLPQTEIMEAQAEPRALQEFDADSKNFQADRVDRRPDREFIEREKPKVRKRPIIITIAAVALVAAGPFVHRDGIGEEIAAKCGINPFTPWCTPEAYVEDNAINILNLSPDWKTR